MIQIYPFHESNYQMLESWWKEHGWPAVPIQKLPPVGFVAWDRVEGESDVPLCAAFAYLDNGGTGVAMLEWTVGNPNVGRLLVKGLKELLNFMIQELKKLDYDVVFTFCRHEGLIRIYEKCGFEVTDKGMTHLVHITQGE